MCVSMRATTSATFSGWRDRSLDKAPDISLEGTRDRQDTQASALETTRNPIVGFMDSPKVYPASPLQIPIPTDTILRRLEARNRSRRPSGHVHAGRPGDAGQREHVAPAETSCLSPVRPPAGAVQL